MPDDPITPPLDAPPPHPEMDGPGPDEAAVQAQAEADAAVAAVPPPEESVPMDPATVQATLESNPPSNYAATPGGPPATTPAGSVPEVANPATGADAPTLEEQAQLEALAAQFNADAGLDSPRRGKTGPVVAGDEVRYVLDEDDIETLRRLGLHVKDLAPGDPFKAVVTTGDGDALLFHIDAGAGRVFVKEGVEVVAAPDAIDATMNGKAF